MSAAHAGPLRRAGWWIGALVGVVAGSALAVVVQDWQEAREASDVAARAEVFHREDTVPPPVDAVRSLLAQDSLVAVDPLLVDRVSEDDVARAEAILADAPVPARIAYLAYPQTGDVGYTPTGAAVQWSTAVGEVGHYVVLWDDGGTESTAVGLEEHYVDGRTQGQPGPALVRLAAEMAAWEAVPLRAEPDEASDQDYWGGTGGGLAAAAVMGALGVVPAFLVLRWYVGTRRRKAA